ncbi:MAG TPA: glycosyltransferase family 9 protein, partial [Candidatus Didemnitutus sp.]|nr:glycosyltransferase family 9 protein [Candidatus Didemnitutus sp.]
WPAERFVRLARHFTETKNWNVVVLGNAQDRAAMPASSGRFLNWAGELTPAQSWRLLCSATLFVGNDSGAVHLAAAAGCRCVVVSWDLPDSDPNDANSHRRFHPYEVHYRLVHPQSPDRRREASLVSYDAVLRAAEDLASASNTASPV